MDDGADAEYGLYLLEDQCCYGGFLVTRDLKISTERAEKVRNASNVAYEREGKLWGSRICCIAVESGEDSGIQIGLYIPAPMTSATPSRSHI